MKSREQARKMHRIIKKAMKPSSRSALAMVETTEPDGSTAIHLTKTSIESAGLTENNRRFRQTNNTPLQHPIAINLLGRTGGKAPAAEILRSGQAPAELLALDPFLGDYLYAHKVGLRTQLSQALTTADHSQGWIKAREATSSGKTDLHFGHFISGTTNANIAAFEACLSGIPWMTGYSPRRWRQGLHIMMEKRPGARNVLNLRTILLMEADFNQGNKRLGRQLMRNAEQLGILALEQYGSRKYYMAINQGLNKRLTFDILRQKRQRGALCSTDAMSCYDRITHIAASLAMQRAGAPLHAIHCMLDTLQHLRHHIRTVFGDSIAYFDSDDKSGIPLGGIGQGNGAGPAIWALVSTLIFDALRHRGYGVFLQCPISGQLLHFAGYAFVDDTDLCVTDHELSYDTVTTSIALKIWEGFIRASGGALRPEKATGTSLTSNGPTATGNTHDQPQPTTPSPSATTRAIPQRFNASNLTKP